jgi:hypothetical protein
MVIFRYVSLPEGKYGLINNDGLMYQSISLGMVILSALLRGTSAPLAPSAKHAGSTPVGICGGPKSDET